MSVLCDYYITYILLSPVTYLVLPATLVLPAATLLAVGVGGLPGAISLVLSSLCRVLQFLSGTYIITQLGL